MPKQQFIQPTIATPQDGTCFANTMTVTPGGEIQIITTGETVNTIGPDKHVVVGDMIVGAGHYKNIPTDLYVDGNIIIQRENDVTIGDDTVQYKGLLEVNGNITCMGDFDVLGDLIFTDEVTTSPTVDNTTKAGSSDETGWTLIESGEFVGFYQKQISFETPFSDDRYAVMLQTVEYFDVGYITAINKVPDSFSIVTVPPSLPPDKIDWIAVKY